MYCAAADVQVPGVSKWELANYVRSMPGRGGVGTYCHTEFGPYRRRPGARLELALPPPQLATKFVVATTPDLHGLPHRAQRNYNPPRLSAPIV